MYTGKERSKGNNDNPDPHHFTYWPVEAHTLVQNSNMVGFSSTVCSPVHYGQLNKKTRMVVKRTQNTFCVSKLRETTDSILVLFQQKSTDDSAPQFK